MLNEDFKPKTLEKEKDFLILVSVSVLFIILHAGAVLFSPSFADSTNTGAGPSEFMTENITLTDTWNFVLQDGGSESVNSAFQENWSADGWILTSVIVEISYDETATGDGDCDTVSAELMITGDSGDEPVTSTTSGSVSDCSLIILEMRWQDLTEELDVDYLQPPFEIETDVSLNVDSTIPFNDNDEQIDVSIEVIMSRVQVN
ncbi:MAG: hypothetical protein OSB30_00395 [Candidatus Poseidoniaceae archaeon]|nr:hypothetical protein [Candidatus Poseidoniaceae archaeon]